MFNVVSDIYNVDIDFTFAIVLDALGSPTLLCILGSRIFFNLKEAAEHGVNVGTNWSSYEHSTIRFDEPHDGGEEGALIPSLE